MTRFRLRHNHPVVGRLDRVFDLMDELGISIQVCGDVLSVYDRESRTEYVLCDSEDNVGGNNPSPSSVPPNFEWKLTFEKEVENG